MPAYKKIFKVTVSTREEFHNALRPVFEFTVDKYERLIEALSFLHVVIPAAKAFELGNGEAIQLMIGNAEESYVRITPIDA